MERAAGNMSSGHIKHDKTHMKGNCESKVEYEEC